MPKERQIGDYETVREVLHRAARIHKVPADAFAFEWVSMVGSPEGVLWGWRFTGPRARDAAWWYYRWACAHAPRSGTMIEVSLAWRGEVGGAWEVGVFVLPE